MKWKNRYIVKEIATRKNEYATANDVFSLTGLKIISKTPTVFNAKVIKEFTIVFLYKASSLFFIIYYPY